MDTEHGAVTDLKTAETVHRGAALPDASKRREVWDDLEVYFKKGLFILVNIFIVLAAFGLYFSVNNIIDRWVEYQYIPVVQTIYYIAVIVLGLYLMKAYLLKL